MSFVPLQNPGKFGSSIGAYENGTYSRISMNLLIDARQTIKFKQKINFNFYKVFHQSKNTRKVPAASPRAKDLLPDSVIHKASPLSSPLKSEKKDCNKYKI